MRKIILPRLVRSFSISEYAPEIADEKIYVWVNPPISALLSLMESFGAYVQSGDEQLNPYLEKLSAILSQGAEGTGWNADELMEMVKETADTEPTSRPNDLFDRATGERLPGTKGKNYPES